MSKIALVLTTYNRSNYLSACFKSLINSDLWLLDTVLIVDDKSIDPETIQLINKFIKEASEKFDKVEFVAAFSKENGGIKKSLLYGYELLFKTHTDIVNLDPDAVVSNIWLHKIIEAKNQYPEMIVSGFHCNTLNRDGTVRHKVLYTEKNYSFRKTVGGISLYINKTQYYNWVKPALEGSGNWDMHACLNSAAESMPVCVTVPSVISHIGSVSAMGHHLGGEPADQADDFKQWYLDDISLIAVDDNPEGIIKAANISCIDIEFASVKLLSSGESYDPRIIKIRRLGSKMAYSQFVMKELYDYISTPYFITIQADGYILNGSAFDPEWRNYSYIGSPWEWYVDNMQVGNGAASFRSRELHKILKQDSHIIPTNDHLISECQEDHNIGRIYRPYLELRYGIKFPPIEVARIFGIEAWNATPEQKKYKGQFAFHGRNVDFSESNIKNKPY